MPLEVIKGKTDADKYINNGTTFLILPHNKVYTLRGGAKELDRSNLFTVELLIK